MHVLFSSPTLVAGSLSSEFLIPVLIFERTVNDFKCNYLPEANLSKLGFKSERMECTSLNQVCSLMSGLVLGKAVH